MIKHILSCSVINQTTDILESERIELIELEHGEVILTKQEVSELAEVLSTEFISYEKIHAKQAVSKMMKAQKS